jgi:hypothetical protein
LGNQSDATNRFERPITAPGTRRADTQITVDRCHMGPTTPPDAQPIAHHAITARQKAFEETQ